MDGLSKPIYKDICECEDKHILLTGIHRYSKNVARCITYTIIGDESGITYRSRIYDHDTNQDILDTICSLGGNKCIEEFLTEEKPTYVVCNGALRPLKLTQVDYLGISRFPEGYIPFSFWTGYKKIFSEHYYLVKYFSKEWLDDENNLHTPGYQRKKEISDTILNIKNMGKTVKCNEDFHPEILDGLYKKLNDFLYYLCSNRDEQFIMCFIPSSDQVWDDKNYKNCMMHLMEINRNCLPNNITVLNDLLQRTRIVKPNHLDGNRWENCETIFVNENYKETIRDKHIILMDDVTTTGITTHHGSKILSMAGARRVTTVTLSKTYVAYKRKE